MRSNWIAWGITIGEGILLLGFGIVLSEYWLMLPVWMRSSAGFGLGIGFLIVVYRFFKFRRIAKCASLKKGQRERESAEVSI
jgi:hypothetical protein